MVGAWSVRLGLARDDGGSLSDEGILELTGLLTKEGVKSAVSRPDSKTVLVEMAIDARDDMEARTAAESTLREQANKVWSALELPPFTITFVEAKPPGDP